jgi:enoyl-CoA hydratase/carnithine racemase
MEVKWGLVPDMAITAAARYCVRLDRLSELAWTGRIVGAEEAVAIGLVTSVVNDAEQHAMAIATAIARHSPDAIRGIKKLFLEAWQLPVAEALSLEAHVQLGLMGKPNQREAVAANVECRDARFVD